MNASAIISLLQTVESEDFLNFLSEPERLECAAENGACDACC